MVRIGRVSKPADTAAELGAAQLRALHEARALAELSAADALVPGSDAVAWRGALMASVVVVKGLPGPAEASGKPALSGADGDAVQKALAALGHDPATVFYTLTRPVSGSDERHRIARLRLQLEAVDPELVVAVDADALADLATALGFQVPKFGIAITAGGRRIVACDGLEASLSDSKHKLRVWAQLKAAVPSGPVY